MKIFISLPYIIFLFFLQLPMSPLVAQLNFEISFDIYEEEYTPLSGGDTLFGTNGEIWSGLGQFKEIFLQNEISIPGLENVEFSTLIVESRGLSYMAHFHTEEMIETMFYLSPLLLNYCSPLNDELHLDQGYIIYQEKDGLITLEYNNVASREELNIGFGILFSRFNFQLEYRVSDSRVRYLYGSSSITPDMQDYIREEYALSVLAFEQWILEDENQDLWDILDLNYLVLFGLGEDPMISRPQTLETLPTFSLVSVPPEGTVYEFNISPSSFTSEIDPSEFNWKIWPNPANDFVNLSIESLPDGFTEMDLQLYNSKGKFLKSKTIQDSYTLDVKSYTPGVYFITLRSGDFQQTKRWVKN